MIPLVIRYYLIEWEEEIPPGQGNLQLEKKGVTAPFS